MLKLECTPGIACSDFVSGLQFLKIKIVNCESIVFTSSQKDGRLKNLATDDCSYLETLAKRYSEVSTMLLDYGFLKFLSLSI